MFTILVPTYNRAKLLRKCLTSIKEQLFAGYEVFILDDNSSDDTGSVVEEFCMDSRFQYIKFSSNNGFVKNVDWVISNKKNSFEWIIIIGDDDRLGDATYLAKCRQAISCDDNASLVLADCVYDYGIFTTFTQLSVQVPEVFKGGTLSDEQRAIMYEKFTTAYHISLIEKYKLFKLEKNVTFEMPLEKFYLHESVVYAKGAEYIFLIHQSNREKYLKIENFILSMVLPELQSFQYLANTLGTDVATARIVKKITDKLTDTSSTVPALIDTDLTFIGQLLTPFLGDEAKAECLLSNIASLIAKYYQPSLDEKYDEILSCLVDDENKEEAIGRAQTFAIYGLTDWGRQIAHQLAGNGKQVLAFIDDGDKYGAITIDKFSSIAGGIDAIVLASARPNVVLNMTRNLKKHGIELPILSLLPVYHAKKVSE